MRDRAARLRAQAGHGQGGGSGELLGRNIQAERKAAPDAYYRIKQMIADEERVRAEEHGAAERTLSRF